MEKNLNDGKNHSLDEIKEISFEQAAKQFSEGDETLAQILLSLWELNIETVACCIGRFEEYHQQEDDKIIKSPYVTLKIDENNVDKVMTLIKHVVNNKDACKPNIRFDRFDFDWENQSHHISSVTFERSFLTKQSAKSMFNTLLGCINDLKNNKELKKDKPSETLGLIEAISQSKINNPFIEKCEIKINHSNQSQFYLGPVNPSRNRKSFKCRINANTIDEIKRHCSNVTTKKFKTKARTNEQNI